MTALASQRCFHHLDREAVARCPECRQFFCRECVLEHEGRVICASCLKKITHRVTAGRGRFAGLLLASQCALGIFAAWLFFYLAGRTLLLIPTSFHAGTLWESMEEGK